MPEAAELDDKQCTGGEACEVMDRRSFPVHFLAIWPLECRDSISIRMFLSLASHLYLDRSLKVAEIIHCSSCNLKF